MNVSCKKATVLIEKQTMTPLTFSERVKLRIHLGMCSGCRNFKLDTEKMDQLLKLGKPAGTQKIQLSEKIKQDIIDNCK